MVGLFPGGNPFAVMYVMLVKALQAQCTPEQYEDFGKRLERFEICGTYATARHLTFMRWLLVFLIFRFLEKLPRHARKMPQSCS